MRYTLAARGLGGSVFPALAVILTLSVTSVITSHSSIAATTPPTTTQVFPGGFLEKATSADVRPRLTDAQIQSMLPSRGAFTFPTPYNTQAVRISNADDCGGADCVDPVGYSYWANINNHTASDTMLIFLGLNRGRGGPGPTLYSYDKVTEQVANLGPLFDASSQLSYATAEQWYFSATLPHALYVLSGSSLLRYDVITRQVTTVFDATRWLGSGVFLWQTHSSADDRVHIGTIRSTATSEMLGCAAYQEDTDQFSYYPARGILDECHLDKSGRWMVMLDNVDLLNGEDNRIIDLQTGSETLLMDQEGAAGHADMGYGYMVAEDNWALLPGAIRMWKLGQTPLVGQLVYAMTDWRADAGHISHGNAVPGVAPEQQYVCSSNATRVDAARSNEIVCYRLDSSMDVAVVAPVMTDLDANGGGDDYSKRPKGNLDVTGGYFIWTSNMGGGRLDAFIVKVPSHLLAGTGLDVTPPSVEVISPSGGLIQSGIVNVTASATDDVGVVGVQLQIDGADLGGMLTSAPYTVSWDASTSSPGTHILGAVAHDAAGNYTTSAGVPVTLGGVLRPPVVSPPVISSVGSSDIGNSEATVTWSTDTMCDTQVEYGETTAYGTVTPLQAAMVTLHQTVLSGLSAGSQHHYRVLSRDSAGQLSMSDDQVFTTTTALSGGVGSPGGEGGGLLGYWNFDDTGIIATDSSPNHFDGTLVNGPIRAPGWLGEGLQFDGRNDFVRVPHRDALNAFPLTIVASVNTVATGQYGIVNKYVSGSFNGYQIFTSGGNVCAWYFRNQSNNVYDGTGCTLASPGIADGLWHQVAFVIDETGGYLYVDGVLKASRGWTGLPGPPTTGQMLSFGRFPQSRTPFLPGTLDEVQLYSRALPAQEVADLYAQAMASGAAQ